MGSTGFLFVVMAALVVLRCAAQDQFDIVDCETPDGPLCTQSSEDGSMVLFSDPCVLDCTNYQLKAAGVGVEYTLVNDSDQCDSETKFIRKCPELVLETENSDGDVDVVESEDSDGDVDVEQPLFSEDGLSFAVIPSFPDGFLGRLMATALSPSLPPQPQEGNLMFVDADLKLTVNININNPGPPGPSVLPPPPPPPPPPSQEVPLWLSRVGMLLPPPAGVEYQVGEAVVTSAAGPPAHLTIAAALVTLIVATLHI